jgi:hypothetical protein
VIAKHIAHTEPKVRVEVLDMLVDNPHITIFWIVLVIHMTREALGLHSVSFIREENLLQMVLWKTVHFALFLVKISINFSPGYSTVFFHHSVRLYFTKI